MTHKTKMQSEIPYAVRADVADALYRFAAGQDFKDPELFRSSFSRDAVLDFIEPARQLGLDIRAFEGREAIADAVIGATANLTTTHTVSNLRFIQLEGDRALVTALIEAQHLPAEDHSRNLLLKNKLTVEMTIEDGQWVIERMEFRNMWREGDPGVLFPAVADQSPAPASAVA